MIWSTVDTLLANVVYEAGNQVWWATVRALGSKNPDERHPFCHYPQRDPETLEYLNPVARDLAQSLSDDILEFHQPTRGIANASY